MREKNIKQLNEKIVKENESEDIVLGNGSLDSKIVLIGEAPGAKEIEMKKLFVGQSGKYLEEFLNILEINREDIYITNVVKFRPTKISKKTEKKINRTPSKKEIESFKDYLLDEISIINPDIIVTLGNTPLQTILGDVNSKIGELHGQLFQLEKISYNIFPLYHPAAVIYRKKLKEVYMDDLEKLKRIIKF